MSSVRGYDNLYNDSVNDIALMNYNKGIANRLRLQEQEMQNKLPFKEPKMLGGVRASNSIIAGTSIDGTPRAVGGGASRRFTGNETPAEGGKINRLKKANKWLEFSKGAVGDAFDLAGMGGKVNRAKKAQKWLDYSKGVVGDALNIYDQAKARGGVNRLKKANKWLEFSKGAVGDALNIYDQAKTRGGVNRAKKAQKWLDYSKGVVGDAFNIYDQAKARGGMVYSPDLQKAIGCSDCSGGAKKPRKSRFVKGSPDAKAFMASIRAKKAK
jgi:ribosomal protein L20